MFMLVDRPVIFPAQTLLGNSGGPVVDTGCELLSGGRVYIDRVEASEIARHFGFETPESAASRTRRIEELEQQLDQALGAIARIRDEVVAQAATV